MGTPRSSACASDLPDVPGTTGAPEYATTTGDRGASGEDSVRTDPT
jgi:hypothetical protein